MSEDVLSCRQDIQDSVDVLTFVHVVLPLYISAFSTMNAAVCGGQIPAMIAAVGGSQIPAVMINSRVS
jgi:hypothetical protein